MANNLDFQVNWVNEKQIMERFNRLDAVGKKIWKKTATRIIPPFVAKAKAQAPVNTGLLRKSIAGNVNRYGNVRIFINTKVFAAQGNKKWMIVKLKGNARKTSWDQRRSVLGKLKRPSKYAKALEFGRKKRSLMAPRPFFLNVFGDNKVMILKAISDDFERNLALEVNKIK